MVHDMDRSIKFYESLGLTLKQRWDNHYAMISAPGLTIGLHPAEGDDLNSGTVSIGFMVNDIDPVKTRFEREKISYTEEDGKSGYYVHFCDPDGTLLYFVKPGWN